MREVVADVAVAFPGQWRARTAFMVPDRYALTVFTTGEPDHYLFDGGAVHTFIGAHEVSVDTGPAAPLRTQARFTAVANLDALLLPGVRVAPIPRAELPPDVHTGIVAVFADDGSRYRLGFDDRGLLVWAAGPLDLPPIGRGDVVARYADFRRVRRLLLPFRTEYSLEGQRLAAERVVALCVDDPAITEASFRRSDLIPECGAE